MPWKRNKSALARRFRDLAYLPRGRCEWDCTLSCLAYGVRMDIEGNLPDLNAWAARHGVPASKRYEDLGADALVVWHGTSRERAEKIVTHGLFHKKGLWTAIHPSLPHSFCRGRSERFRTEGAVVCLVLDKSQLAEGRNYNVEGAGNVIRFHHGLPPDVVEYVLVKETILFNGESRARTPRMWPKARFLKRDGQWEPLQKTPVRYTETERFSSVDDFARICVRRLLSELQAVSPLEVFSVLYALVSPWEALRHDDVMRLFEEAAAPGRHYRKVLTFRARREEHAVC